MTKKFYTVTYTTIGSNFKSTKWFDNLDEAKEFASHDYRDGVVTRVARTQKTIDKYNKLVAECH